jgi:ABC-type transport system involved in multi-copper enzyme maturation permease subunit
MFAALPLERAPLTVSDVPTGVLVWVQVAGGLSFVLILGWLLIRWLRRFSSSAATTHEPLLPSLRMLFGLLVLAAAVCYGAYGFANIRNIGYGFASLSGDAAALPPEQTAREAMIENWSSTIGGACALLAISLPFLGDFFRFRWRRIWAVAKLSFKEATRRRLLWVFSALLLVVLFGSWFIPYDEQKPEDQVRSYVTLVYWAMTPFLLIVASMVAAFSLPTDIKQQTIHTILTKPVLRFEVVLGRFLGYTIVFTIILVFMTAFSMLYVLRGVDKDAADESFKARVPAYGELEFEGTERRDRGENVGKEWDYRSYIAGPMTATAGKPLQYAIWSFDHLPRSITDRDTVRCEFNFDIYRTTKGEENLGVFCTLYVETWQWDPQREKEFKADRDKLRGTAAANASELALKYGYFERRQIHVVNNHTILLDIPSAVFVNQLQSADELRQRLAPVEQKAQPLRERARPLRERKKEFEKGDNPRALPLTQAEETELANLNLQLEPLEHKLGPLTKLQEMERKGEPRPPIKIRVQCTSRTQFLGMAKYDLYLRLDDPNAGNDQVRFFVNFFKGASGLWFRLCLVIGIATALSTYLTGVISWLTTMFIYLGGLSRDFIESVSQQTNIGGGPAVAALRLVKREPLIGELEQTATVQVATASDSVYRLLLKGIIKLIPDVEIYDLADRVREGFDIPPGMLLTYLVILVGILVPWGLLAYYLMKSREVATG